MLTAPGGRAVPTESLSTTLNGLFVGVERRPFPIDFKGTSIAGQLMLYGTSYNGALVVPFLQNSKP